MSPHSSVNIQDPPVREIHKQRSCIKRGCFSGCGCSVFLFIGFLFLLNILTGSGSNIVKQIPQSLPEDIVIYEEERIDTIRISDPVPTGPIASLASYIPKIVLTSIYITLGDNSPNEVRTHYKDIQRTNDNALIHFFKLLQAPIIPDTEHIEISWHPLTAEPTFINAFYVGALQKEGYTVHQEKTSTNGYEIEFQKDDILGTILIEDTDDTHNGTEYVLLRVSVPRQ